MEDGNFGRAVESLEALAKLLPDNILPPINLAICHFRLNQPERALAQVRRAQTLDSDNTQMLFTLALILQDQSGTTEEWEAVLEHFAATHPRDPRPHFLRAEQRARDRRWDDAYESFAEATRRDPENLMLLTEQLVAAAEAQNLEATSDALDAVEDRLNGFEDSQAEFADQLRDLIDDEQGEALRPPALVLRNLLRPSELYQLGLVPITGGGPSGSQLFPQLDFDPPLPKSIQGGQDIAVAFADVTPDWASMSDGDARITLLAPDLETVDLLRVSTGGWSLWSLTQEAESGLRQEVDFHGIESALHQDFDQDAISDLIGIAPEGTLWFFRGNEGGFAPGTRIFEATGCGGLARLHPLDLDHEGDLDLLVTCPTADDLYLQNNGDGSWSDQTRELGLGDRASTDATSADFDDDGDLDLLTTHTDGVPHLYINRRAGPLLPEGQAWGLASMTLAADGVDAADFDNDGLFDLLFWGPEGAAIYLNQGQRFTPWTAADLPAGPWQGAVLGDFDNDGDQDVIVALADPLRLALLRNRRSSIETELVADTPPAAVSELLSADFDRDGDLDIAARLREPAGKLAFWRNEGGNRNQWLALRLVGRNTNNSKNNSQGLFTRLEVRIGDAYQVQIGNGGINHLGLGAARQADIIRVVWTNGLAQSWLRVSANRNLVEEQILKGSCPFLYTWNGEGFEFVTDLMWRSPLGMTLPDGSAAPHQSARDYVMIPGDRLVPVGDDLWIQITEELWETVYVDDLELIAVDHPEGVDMVVDEAFRPPPHPRSPPVHWIDRRIGPWTAYDSGRRSVMREIRDRDEDYVADLPLTRYQGITQGHFLEMTFRDVPEDEPLRLVLWGWIFPTDTSINLALHQNSQLQPRPPSLEIRDTSGDWRTLVPFIGFPNGKRKAVVVDLGPSESGPRLDLRISTNMQIYWDAATLAVGDPEVPVQWTRLRPAQADLHYRGFSRMYRKSASGPHLFDYSRVEIGPRFRDLEGAYTRFGRVETLLGAPDDRYVVMNAGDEITVRFDASELPPLADGWRRDWILYTDGWVKDGDIHTSHSQTVEPLPYHGMSSYPDTPQHAYPDTPDHREYRRRFQTRSVNDEPFRSGLRPAPTQLDGTQPNG